MKKTHLMAVVAAAIVLTIPAALWAQQSGQPGTYRPAAPPAATPPPRALPIVAVIDIQFIFKNYTLHKTKRDGMKARFEQVNNEIKQERTKILKLAEQLKGFRIGTPEFKQLEERAAKREADLAVRVRMLQREFGELEARMIYETYVAIQQQVDAYCRQTGTIMVLQHDREPIDPAQPDGIRRLASQRVVWHAGHDITDVILQELNRRAGDPNRSATRPGINPLQR